MDTTEEHIRKLVSLVTMIRVVSKERDYGPTVKAVGAMNGLVTKYMLDRKNRKPVIAMLLGRYVSSTKKLTAGEVRCIDNAFRTPSEDGIDTFTAEDVHRMEAAVMQSIDSANLLPWDDNNEINTITYQLALIHDMFEWKGDFINEERP